MIEKISALHLGLNKYSDNLYVILGIIIGFEMNVTGVENNLIGPPLKSTWPQNVRHKPVTQASDV